MRSGSNGGSYVLDYWQPFVHNFGSYDPHRPDEKEIRRIKKSATFSFPNDDEAIQQVRLFLAQESVMFEGIAYPRSPAEFRYERTLDTKSLRQAYV
jgi:hypothetical protein